MPTATSAPPPRRARPSPSIRWPRPSPPSPPAESRAHRSRSTSGPPSPASPATPTPSPPLWSAPSRSAPRSATALTPSRPAPAPRPSTCTAGTWRASPSRRPPTPISPSAWPPPPGMPRATSAPPQPSDGPPPSTGSPGAPSVDVHGWNLASLAITTTADANFTLGVAATTRDAEGNLSTTTTASEAVTVNPLAPTLAPVATGGIEGASIALNLGTTVTGLAGDANALAALVVSAIPLGATLGDGTHTFTASAGATSVDVHGWNLASLAITPAADANFTLGVAATTKDADGNLSTTTTASDAVTVNPLAPTLAPVATGGIEGSSIALNLATTVTGLAGDANALATLVVSAIPLGATLGDGTHPFTASAGATSVD